MINAYQMYWFHSIISFLSKHNDHNLISIESPAMDDITLLQHAMVSNIHYLCLKNKGIMIFIITK